MKKTALLIALTVPSLFLTSCIVETGGSDLGYTPSSYAPANSYGSSQQEAYNDGYATGRKDAAKGRQMNFMVHSAMYDATTKDKFGEGYMNAYRNYSRHNVNPGHPQGYGKLTASVGQGQIQIMQGGQVVSTLRTASPNIEQHHFTAGQSQMVVKSRGNHGPATVQLFDTRTGALRDKVLAYAIQNGQPAWARGMQD